MSLSCVPADVVSSECPFILFKVLTLNVTMLMFLQVGFGLCSWFSEYWGQRLARVKGDAVWPYVLNLSW